MTLNDKDTPLNSRLANLLNLIRSQRPASHEPHRRLSIVSHNNFPTASGLASSASGYAAVTKAVCELFGDVSKCFIIGSSLKLL